MSNLAQFYGKGFPIGGSITMNYVGDVYTAPDGTKWLANTTTAPFAYTSEYAAAAGIMTSPHPLMAGPESNGLWCPDGSTMQVAYKASGTLTCTSRIYGDTTNGYTYATTTSNTGASWTLRSFPNTKDYQTIVFTGGKFVGVSNSSTTNGVITSTDAVTWSSVTGISASYQDVVSDGANNFVAVGTSTTWMYSTDAAATWTTTTAVAPTNFSYPGKGVITWNAGAGLFIANNAAAGQYQTSPTGATWTTRNSQATYLPYQNRLAADTKFASNSTMTVAVGRSTFFATTTDGLTWSNHGFISPTLSQTTSIPDAVYYDGTRFVVKYSGRVFYSTNGTSWTEGAYLGGNVMIATSSGVLFMITSGVTVGQVAKLLRVSDVTLTAPQTVCMTQAAPSAHSSTNTYYRIK